MDYRQRSAADRVLMRITKKDAPALGEVRRQGRGDVIVVGADATSRPDWGRYENAIGAAVTRGAEIRQERGERGNE